MFRFDSAYIVHPDGETTDLGELSTDEAIGVVHSHNWRAELSKFDKLPSAARTEPGLRLFLPTNRFLWIEPEPEGTIHLGYVWPKRPPEPDAEEFDAIIRQRDEIPFSAIDQIIRRFADGDHAWLVAITASRWRCLASALSMPALLAAFIFGGSWLLARAIGFDASRNLEIAELAGWLGWMVAMIVIACAIWLAFARRFFTREEALFGWRMNYRFDRWIFDRLFPEFLESGKESSQT